MARPLRRALTPHEIETRLARRSRDPARHGGEMTPAAWSDSQRLGGLRRFAIAISILNILGHTVLGFEQAWITPFVALASAYSTELMLEILDARLSGRRLKF